MPKNSQDLLIIDSNQNILDILAIIFQQEGYSLECVATGKSALEKCADTNFTLALCNTQLPDMDTRVLIAEIKKRCRDIKLCMMSVAPYNAEEYRLVGAMDIIAKPLARQQLLETVKNILDDRRSTKRLPLELPLTLNQGIEGTSLSISSDSILFKSAHPFKEGSKVELTIKNPDNKKILKTTGKVKRVNPAKSLYVTVLYFMDNIGQDLLDNINIFLQ